jgi:plastocyanin
MRKVWPIAVAVIIIVAVAAIVLANKDNKTATPPPAPASNTNNSTKESNNNPSPAPTPEASTNNSVSIVNMNYSPADITVKKGTKVTWTNNDDVAHTVTADTGNAFDSGNMEKGKTFSFTFDTVGTFPYHCIYHSNMHGKVTVTE